MNMTANITKIREFQEFNGTHMRVQVTEEFVIVSNADGLSSGVYFLNHELERLRYFTYPSLKEAPYNLEVYEDPETTTLQVFVASPDSISIIEHIKSR